MLRVVALGPLPGLGSDERRDADPAPVGLGAPYATLAISGVAIFEATRSIRPSDILRLGAIIVGFALIEGVAERIPITRLCAQWPRVDFRGGMPCAVSHR